MIAVRDYLFLGTIYDTRREDALAGAGITHLLGVTSSFRYPESATFSVCHKPLDDQGTTDLGPAFGPCFDFMDEAKNSGGRVLVFCRRAQNRSPSVVLGYLMSRERLSLREAYTELAELRPEIAPHESYFAQLQALEQTLFGKTTLTEHDRGGSVQAAIRELWNRTK